MTNRNEVLIALNLHKKDLPFKMRMKPLFSSMTERVAKQLVEPDQGHNFRFKYP